MAERQLVPQYKQSFISREPVCGCLAKMPAQLTDITSPYQSIEGKKGKILWVSGCMVTLTLARDSGLDLRIVDRAFFAYPDRQRYFCEELGLTAIAAEQEEFLQHFTIYAEQPQTMPQALPKKLLALRAATNGQLGLSLQGDRLTVVLKGRFLGNATLSDLKQPVTAQALQANPLPELRSIAEIAALCAQSNR